MIIFNLAALSPSIYFQLYSVLDIEKYYLLLSLKYIQVVVDRYFLLNEAWNRRNFYSKNNQLCKLCVFQDENKREIFWIT